MPLQDPFLNPRAMALMGLGTGLLQASGPSFRPQTAGSVLGAALPMAGQFYGQSQQMMGRQAQMNRLAAREAALQHIPGLLQQTGGELIPFGQALMGQGSPFTAQLGARMWLAGREEEMAREAAKLKAADWTMSASDANTLYRGSASLFDATFDAEGNVTALDPTVRPRVQALWARAGQIFNQNLGRIDHPTALSRAAEQLRKEGVTIPEIPKGFAIPPPGDPKLYKNTKERIDREAEAAIRGGLPRGQVERRKQELYATHGITSPEAPGTPTGRGAAVVTPTQTAKPPIERKPTRVREERQWFEDNRTRMLNPRGKRTGLPFTQTLPLSKSEASDMLERLRWDFTPRNTKEEKEVEQMIINLSRYLREQE